MRFFFISILFFHSTKAISQKIAGDWLGNLDVNGQQIPLAFHFKNDSLNKISGTWDSPKQKAFDLPFSEIKINGDSIFLGIKMIIGFYRAKMIGKDSLAGIWHQGNGELNLNFSRSAVKSKILKNVFLPNEKEIAITAADIKIYGTLLSRNNKQKLVIIIAGSGPTDREGNNPLGDNANSYKMIAQSLDSQNIASFRYDKRGVAKSMSSNLNENNLLFEDYINDVKVIFNYLYDSVGYKNIFIMGHSEGSLIGIVAAGKTKVKGYISLAGSGRPIDEVIQEQVRTQLSDTLAKKTKYIFDELKAGKKVTDIPQPLSSLFRGSVQLYLISWLKYSPAIEINKLKCPVLILQGTCDKQIRVKDAKDLHAANPKSELHIIPFMTHTLKDTDENCRDKNNKTYTDISLPLDKILVKDIITFIKKN